MSERRELASWRLQALVVINLEAAKALGLAIPPALLLRPDEVIQRVPSPIA